jgi:hypothetical protein
MPDQAGVATMKDLPRYFTVKQTDGSIWGVPFEIIARNRAEFYASEFDGDVERSLQEDTLPLFLAHPGQIADWATNQMDWSDFDGHQVQLSPPEPVDFKEGWLSGEKGLQ